MALIEARAGDMVHEAEITASVAQGDDHWFLDLRSDRLAQSVQIDFEACRAEDDWFHLPPGRCGVEASSESWKTSAKTASTGQFGTLGSRRIGEV